MVEGDYWFVQVVKVQVSGSAVNCSITKICPVQVHDGNQKITIVHRGRGE